MITYNLLSYKSTVQFFFSKLMFDRFFTDVEHTRGTMS